MFTILLLIYYKERKTVELYLSWGFYITEAGLSDQPVLKQTLSPIHLNTKQTLVAQILKHGEFLPSEHMHVTSILIKK